MPEVRFSFEPADIVSEVMSFGSPTPVEFTVNGPNLAENRAYAEKVQAELAKVPSLRDLQFVQSLDYPTVGVQIDREKAGLSGVSVAEVARSAGRRDVVEPVRRPELLARPQVGDRLPGPGRDPLPGHGLDHRGRDDPDPAVRAASRSCSATSPSVSPGTMPGEYDRYNMKRVVSLTANICGRGPGQGRRPG